MLQPLSIATWLVVLDAALAKDGWQLLTVSPAVRILYIEGDAAKWKKFGNSLKLKLAITIADADAAKAGTMVTEAIAGGAVYQQC